VGGGYTFAHQTKNKKMGKNVQIGFLLGMILLSQNSFGQTMESGSEKIKTGKKTETYLDLVLKMVSTNINYGKSKGYKRMAAGIQFGAGFRFKVKQKNVVLDTRYTYGLSNISNGQEMFKRYLNISLHFSKPWKTNPLGRN
jgi:hypothetical protein